MYFTGKTAWTAEKLMMGTTSLIEGGDNDFEHVSKLEMNVEGDSL